MHRLNTYPFIHTGFFHALLNSLALTPLLDRFETDYGTLTAVALFVGREFSRQPECQIAVGMHRWGLSFANAPWLDSSFDISSWALYLD